jgi:hypothetical protein
MRRYAFAVAALLTAAVGQGQSRPDLSGLYFPAGLEVQPCGHNEWMRRSFDTDQFCLGSDEGFPFTEAGRAAWKAYSPIEDPVLRCIETHPRTAMRGRPMRVTTGERTTEIAYWFNRKWHVRTVHMDGKAAPADTPHTAFGYSTGRWAGDTLVVETTHLEQGPMFNDHKQNSAEARTTERFWRAPDGQNLLMDLALDDTAYYSKPFLLNRQEWIAGNDRPLSETECEPSTIWADEEE